MMGRAPAQPLAAPTGPLIVPRDVALAAHPISLSIVVPTFNEAKNLEQLLGELQALLEPRLGDAYELIVVDDDSPDRTWQLALALCQSQPRLRVVRRQGERGLSTAIIRGWQLARGQVLGVMDADLQHPSEVNLLLLDEIERGAELAVASRHVPGAGVSDWRLRRRLLSRGAQLLGLLSRPQVFRRLTDPLSGYFMARRSLLAGVELSPLGYKLLIEIVARTAPARIGEVGYVFRERLQERSKVTWRVYRDYLRHLARLR